MSPRCLVRPRSGEQTQSRGGKDEQTEPRLIAFVKDGNKGEIILPKIYHGSSTTVVLLIY